MSKSKIILGVVGVLVVVAGIVAGIILVRQRQNLAEKAAPTTALYVSPATLNKKAGEIFSFQVMMDTGTNLVSAIDLRINYDASAIQVSSLEKGSGVTVMDNTISNTYDNTAGKIAYAIFTLDKTKAISGSAIAVLTVNGTIKGTAAAGSYSLTFDPATGASALSEGQNVINSKTPGVIVVSSGTTATATPTTSSTPTPNKTPTPTPTGYKSPTPTPKLTPTPTITPSPIPGGSTNTPTPTPTPSPTPTLLPNSTVTPTPTPIPLPVTGISTPTIIFTLGGMGLIITAFAVFLF